MKIYASWVTAKETKDWVTLKEDDGISVESWYLMEGCPLYALMQILISDARISKIPGEEVARLRKERGLEKTDDVNIQLIKELAETHPELFRELLPIDKHQLETKYRMGKYIVYTKTIVQLKNRRTAALREFGPEGMSTYDSVIEILEKDKISQVKYVKKYIKNEVFALRDMKGIGPAFTSLICALAHPAKFNTVSKYLLYLGLVDRTTNPKKNKYDREAKSLYFNIMSQQMKMKSKYYDLLNQIKEVERQKTCKVCYLTRQSLDCKTRKSDDQIICNGYAHARAQNKVMTILAKEVYRRLKGLPVSATSWKVERRTRADKWAEDESGKVV